MAEAEKRTRDKESQISQELSKFIANTNPVLL